MVGIGRIARRAALLLERFRRLSGDGAQGISGGRDRSPLANAAWKSIRFMIAIEAADAFFARVSGHDPCRCAYCEHGRWRTVAALVPTPRCRAGPS